jgi:hypothetical protein
MKIRLMNSLAMGIAAALMIASSSAVAAAALE